MTSYDLTYEPTRNSGQRFAWTVPNSGVIYTEIGRWNDQSDYRTAGDADWTNFSGGSWCANRGPLNGVADPFPLNSATTYRLRYVQGGAATQASAQIVGTPTQAHIDSSPGGGIWCGRFGTAADMIAVFGNPVSNPGSPPSFHGGQWILEQQGTENEYRLVRRGASNPSPPNTSWTMLSTSAFDPSAAYPTVGTLVTSGGKLFSSLTAINAPGSVNTYTEQARWNAGPTNITGNARYFGEFGDWELSVTPASGSFPSNTSGTWRISQIGGASITGTMIIISQNQSRIVFRIGSIADLHAAFGNADITSGGQWILERMTPAANLLPENDSTHWSEVTTSNWSGTSAYNQNDVVLLNGTYYRANVAISILNTNQLLWQRRKQLRTGDQVIWEYDNTQAVGSRLKVRTV